MVTSDTDRSGLEVLDQAECLRLLALATLGRVAVSANALPMVLPVTFRLVDDQIVFRTRRDTHLGLGTNNSVVAFEVDDIDPQDHSGWSVVVTGIASELRDPDLVDALDAIALPEWSRGEDTRVVAIPVTMISGRRTQRSSEP
jgi:nitroimidazol reductase NimA-like FMN-containing flavoprotein (pyridoxamine 5'-phosphate oxidase superfamily)